MSGAQRLHPGMDMQGFLQELLAFVEFGEADRALVRDTAPVVLKHADALTAALYEHFLGFAPTARFFLKADGTPDSQRLERRKHSLGRWLRETAEAAMTHDFAYYLLAVGLSHSHRTTEPGGRVPPQFLVGAISLVQTALARVLDAELPDPRRALAASVAWNKLLLVHLNALLLGYLLPASR